MKRLLVCAVIVGGCLTAVGCDTGAATGNVPPQVSVTHQNTAPEDKEKAKVKGVMPAERPGGGGNQPSK